MGYKGYNKRLGCLDASLYHANMVLTPKQNSKALIVGATGRGKSYTALSLCYNYARHLAQFLLKDCDRWYEFFPYHENLIVMNKQKMVELINKPKEKYHALLIDEMAILQNARKFMTAENQLINLLYIAMRTNQNFICGTCQADFMSDKQSRILYHAYYDMEYIDAFSFNVNFCKALIIRLKPRDPTGRFVHRVFNREHGVTWDYLAVPLPPREMTDYYDQVREEEMKILAETETFELTKGLMGKLNKTVNGMGGVDKKSIVYEYFVNNPWILEKKDPKYKQPYGSEFIRKQLLKDVGVEVSSAFIREVRREFLENQRISNNT